MSDTTMADMNAMPLSPVPPATILPAAQWQESWTVYETAYYTHPLNEWDQHFAECSSEIKVLSSVIGDLEKQHGKSLPLLQSMFAAFRTVKLPVKAVMVGQDPYPGIGTNGMPIANGLSFSVNRGVPIPASLRNIYGEIQRSGYVIACHGDLSCWADQGVLMLNMALTIIPKTPNHLDIWMPFIVKTINFIGNKWPNAVYMLVGSEARNRLDRHIEKRGKIVYAGHPSPCNISSPFIGSDMFVKANKKMGSGINWTICP